MLKNGEDGPEPSRYGNCSVYKQQPGWSYINLSIQRSIDYLSIIHDLSVSYSSLLVKNIAPFSFINLPLSIIIMSHSYPFPQHFVSGWLTGSYEIFESPGRGRSRQSLWQAPTLPRRTPSLGVCRASPRWARTRPGDAVTLGIDDSWGIELIELKAMLWMYHGYMCI